MLNTKANYGFQEVEYAAPMQTMGDRIRLLREARGLTQERLADILGLTKGAVSQWENGGTENVRLVTFMALCTALMTDPHYLIFGPSRAPDAADTPSPGLKAPKNRKD